MVLLATMDIDGETPPYAEELCAMAAKLFTNDVTDDVTVEHVAKVERCAIVKTEEDTEESDEDDEYNEDGEDDEGTDGTGKERRQRRLVHMLFATLTFPADDTQRERSLRVFKFRSAWERCGRSQFEERFASTLLRFLRDRKRCSLGLDVALCSVLAISEDWRVRYRQQELIQALLDTASYKREKARSQFTEMVLALISSIAAEGASEVSATSDSRLQTVFLRVADVPGGLSIDNKRTSLTRRLETRPVSEGSTALDLRRRRCTLEALAATMAIHGATLRNADGLYDAVDDLYANETVDEEQLMMRAEHQVLAVVMGGLKSTDDDEQARQKRLVCMLMATLAYPAEDGDSEDRRLERIRLVMNAVSPESRDAQFEDQLKGTGTSVTAETDERSSTKVTPTLTTVVFNALAVSSVSDIRQIQHRLMKELFGSSVSAPNATFWLLNTFTGIGAGIKTKAAASTKRAAEQTYADHLYRVLLDITRASEQANEEEVDPELLANMTANLDIGSSPDDPDPVAAALLRGTKQPTQPQRVAQQPTRVQDNRQLLIRHLHRPSVTSVAYALACRRHRCALMVLLATMDIDGETPPYAEELCAMAAKLFTNDVTDDVTDEHVAEVERCAIDETDDSDTFGKGDEGTDGTDTSRRQRRLVLMLFATLTFPADDTQPMRLERLFAENGICISRPPQFSAVDRTLVTTILPFLRDRKRCLLELDVALCSVLAISGDAEVRRRQQLIVERLIETMAADPKIARHLTETVTQMVFQALALHSQKRSVAERAADAVLLLALRSAAERSVSAGDRFRSEDHLIAAFTGVRDPSTIGEAVRAACQMLEDSPSDALCERQHMLLFELHSAVATPLGRTNRHKRQCILSAILATSAIPRNAEAADIKSLCSDLDSLLEVVRAPQWRTGETELTDRLLTLLKRISRMDRLDVTRRLQCLVDVLMVSLAFAIEQAETDRFIAVCNEERAPFVVATRRSDDADVRKSDYELPPEIAALLQLSKRSKPTLNQPISRFARIKLMKTPASASPEHSSLF
jgi:hypothetical protein